MKKMLLSFAHPDDESFATGITVAKYVRSGWQVRLICATLGEAGKSGPYRHITGKAIGAVRRQELESAAHILGIGDIVLLGYPDGSLSGINPGELEDVLYKKITEYAPDVLVTFATNGISNHPDHIKVSYATTYAYQRFAGEISETRQFATRLVNKEPVKKRHFAIKHRYALSQKSFADIAIAGSEPKLYYACLPQSVVTYLQRRHILPEESFDKPLKGMPDKSVTTVISGRRYFSKKERALKSHVTQSEDVERFLAAKPAAFMSQEFFILRMVGLTEVYMGKNDRVKDRL